jgi:hypothetical protein
MLTPLFGFDKALATGALGPHDQAVPVDFGSARSDRYR